ncbi:Tripartite-type tricarboxylate transporter, receptor component TctC [Polaromonas sp. OV174]|uniref:Bug family tripartite tricarboxylate transporter substrate binding protein n=1 Tax=Polaromonas sp. OV174 TaxID=1855300 RepID=UPI0008E32825|nr:tripartite tricarboxylate transporter substrate binding protein [Polaromonas sp. OV174]SFC46680.1 Tripartite-type tricarboxylate transporter, receptor component TctC [Polaromonas sp. OV174]
MNTRRTCLIALACLAGAGSAWAQTPFPHKTLSLIVPYAPGGPTDAMSRTLANAIQPILGQTMIVENKAGAGANIGADYVARAPADGYTLLFGTSAPLAINVNLYQKINYDPVKSFSPIIQVGYLPNVLVVHPSVPAKSVKELIAYVKANPGKLSFASSGSGASSHLAGVLFNMRAGTDIQHIPYKGTGPALNDLLGGQVAMSFTDVLTALPHIKAGKLRVLGVTSATRSRALPEVLTLMEQGVKDFDASVFFGIVAPAGTPQDVVAKLNTAFTQVLQQPDVKQRLAEQGLEPPPQYTPAQLAGYMRSETAKWREVIKVSGAKAD